MNPETLAEIHAASFDTPRPWSAAEFADLVASPLCILVTVPDGFALGRAVADEAELLTIAVRPEARRKGAGRALVAAFLAEARRRGAARAFLEVADDNGAAIGLYRSAGFAETGRRAGYYGRGAAPVDAVLLACALD